MNHFTQSWVLSSPIRYIEISNGPIFWKLSQKLGLDKSEVRRIFKEKSFKGKRTVLPQFWAQSSATYWDPPDIFLNILNGDSVSKSNKCEMCVPVYVCFISIIVPL